MNISHIGLQNDLCEFTTREHRFLRRLCAQKPGLNVRFKDFWYLYRNKFEL